MNANNMLWVVAVTSIVLVLLAGAYIISSEKIHVIPLLGDVDYNTQPAEETLDLKDASGESTGIKVLVKRNNEPLLGFLDPGAHPFTLTLPDGTTVTAVDSVAFAYEVTNTGNTDLSTYVLNDDFYMGSSWNDIPATTLCEDVGTPPTGTICSVCTVDCLLEGYELTHPVGNTVTLQTNFLNSEILMTNRGYDGIADVHIPINFNVYAMDYYSGTQLPPQTYTSYIDVTFDKPPIQYTLDAEDDNGNTPCGVDITVDGVGTQTTSCISDGTYGTTVFTLNPITTYTFTARLAGYSDSSGTIITDDDDGWGTITINPLPQDFTITLRDTADDTLLPGAIITLGHPVVDNGGGTYTVNLVKGTYTAQITAPTGYADKEVTINAGYPDADGNDWTETYYLTQLPAPSFNVNWGSWLKFWEW